MRKYKQALEYVILAVHMTDTAQTLGARASLDFFCLAGNDWALFCQYTSAYSLAKECSERGDVLFDHQKFNFPPLKQGFASQSDESDDFVLKSRNHLLAKSCTGFWFIAGGFDCASADTMTN